MGFSNNSGKLFFYKRNFVSLRNYGILTREINEYLILRIYLQLFIENGLLIGKIKIKITKNVVIDFNLQILLKFKNENHF